MRAISPLSLEAGTSTICKRACSALRIQVNMSATGSVIFIARASALPAGLGDAGQLAAVGKLPEAHPTHRELPVVSPGAATQPAAVAVANRKLGFLETLGDHRESRHRGFLRNSLLRVRGPERRHGAHQPSAGLRSLI